MTLAQLKTKADAKLADFWTLLQTKQNAYYAKNGKYFQLLLSPDSAVVDGVDSTWQMKNPPDEKYLVDVDFPWTDLIPFQIQVDEWVGPSGEGFMATVTAQLPDGRVFKRSRDSDQNDTDWYEDLANNYG